MHGIYAHACFDDLDFENIIRLVLVFVFNDNNNINEEL